LQRETSRRWATDSRVNRLTREHGGDYWVWSRADDPRGPFPVLIGDITLVMRFVITPGVEKEAIEREAYRQLLEEATGEGAPDP
jgi:hypothetical protein